MKPLLFLAFGLVSLISIFGFITDNTTTKGLVGEGLLKIIVIHLHSSHEKLLLSALGIALNLLQQGYGEDNIYEYSWLEYKTSSSYGNDSIN